MSRSASLVALSAIALLAVGGVGPATAQDSSPVATTAPAQPDSIRFVDAAGVEHGTITIKQVADPFTEFNPAYPPAEGSRYVVLSVTFEAAADQSFGTDPNAVLLQGSGGYLLYPASVPRPPESVVPDVQSQTLAPSDRVSGVIGYIIPDTATITGIFYRPDGARLLPLKSGTVAGPAIGEPVPFVDPEGITRGNVSVREVLDPYLDFDPNAPAPEGTRYVLLTVGFEAAADRALWADPSAITIVDTNGFLSGLGNVPRTPQPEKPPLESQTMSPGDKISGVLGYVVPTAAQISAVLYWPQRDRVLTVASLTPGS